MVILGIDAHKQTHTVVVVDEHGRKLGERTVKTTTTDHLDLLVWASRFGTERRWAVEDCRHLSRRLERDLLGAGQQVARVPPKLMANARTAGRTYGKSDPIDALAVARAALREPDLPVARLDGPARELRLLVDHRDDLVAERTRVINRLRWPLHELDPSWQLPARSLSRAPATLWVPKTSSVGLTWASPRQRTSAMIASHGFATALPHLLPAHRLARTAHPQPDVQERRDPRTTT
jgi:transposase